MIPVLDLDALEAEHEALLAFLYMCPVGVVQLGADGTVQLMNPHAAQLLMPLAGAALIHNLFQTLQNCAPELRNLSEAFAGERGQICSGHQIVVSTSGPGARVLSCSLLKVSNVSLVAVLQDVSREVEQAGKLRQNEALFAALVSTAHDFALLSLDAAGQIDAWNASAARQTGFRAQDVIGRDLSILHHPDDTPPGRAAEQVRAAEREGWSLREARCVRRDGRAYWCQILVAATEAPEGGVTGYSVVMRDVTERHVTGEDLRRLLTTDHLTGAVNRAHFFEQAAVELGRRALTGQTVSVIMLDVDHFKQVNDNLGHAAGDALLRALVRCCRASLRPDDVLARLGGEEFAVLLPGSDLAEAASMAETLRLNTEVELQVLDGQSFNTTISLGCCEMADDCDGIDALLRMADEAMYRAKRQGRNRVVTALPLAVGAAA